MGCTESVARRPENYIQDKSDPNRYGMFNLIIPHSLLTDITSTTPGGPASDQQLTVRYNTRFLSPQITDEFTINIPCHWDGSRLKGQTFTDNNAEFLIDLEVSKFEHHVIFDGTYTRYGCNGRNQGFLHCKFTLK